MNIPRFNAESSVNRNFEGFNQVVMSISRVLLYFPL